jgi:AbrB family looped-hinge helix DNA binding protein
MGHLTDTKVSEKYLTTIPKPVRNFLGAGDGDTVEWPVADGEVLLRVREE